MHAQRPIINISSNTEGKTNFRVNIRTTKLIRITIPITLLIVKVGLRTIAFSSASSTNRRKSPKGVCQRVNSTPTAPHIPPAIFLSPVSQYANPAMISAPQKILRQVSSDRKSG
jgi:hypothetical protein